MTSDFAAFSLRRCDLLQHTVDHCLFSCVNVFRAHLVAKLSVVGEAVERYTVSVSDLLQLGRIRQLQKRSERGALGTLDTRSMTSNVWQLAVTENVRPDR